MESEGTELKTTATGGNYININLRQMDEILSTSFFLNSLK